MPYNMRLSKKLRTLWKVKIQDRETLYEEPHVTIWRKDEKWRYGLRTRCFLDPKPDPAEVPNEIVELIEAQYKKLCQEWNARFPQNPVTESEDDNANPSAL